ncbi:NAD(P)/FAD-dependent oxidoreductase [Skermanella rosea]|uniref:NAD(P)/FAD-dependent oxidoreductase n=1 Tax=Skermanella rosea TaxID=1817965 RepID=UPI001E36462A|nr:NAD(P)/FAD-dependent oxidoreductase [Skermanella rosea]UEM04590.1 NAD(P)/FAD-dependent oxidoreductase [Skermanella rosea]
MMSEIQPNRALDGVAPERVDCVVIGAGVIGLAVARQLALAGRDVVLLEGSDCIGSGTSSRNSEVIHAGLYYPKGSLKARLCVRGRDALYAYCADRGVPHRRCGKLLVATDEGQRGKLAEIDAKARANGVTDLEWLSAADVAALEPALHTVGALHSPSSGIVDTHGLMLAYQGELEDHGGMVAFNSPVAGGRVTDDGIIIETGGPEPFRLIANLVVNSGGLFAQEIARSIQGIPADSIPPIHLAKGNYFSLARRAPFSRLIYPVPEPGGLGVHLTLDLAGQARFGPDVEWIDRINYDVDIRRADKFYGAIRRYWPDLPDDALQPGYAGIRPKLVAAGVADADFMIQGPRQHGVPGLLNLYGIESPGITASLAIAAEAEAVLLERETAPLQA